MNPRQQAKNSQEAELQQRVAELADLRARHAEARAVLQSLREEVSRFESIYDRALGGKVAELERIEGEISRLCSNGKWEYRQAQSSFADAWEDTFQKDVAGDSRDADESQEASDGRDARDSQDEAQWQEPPVPPKAQDIKALFREVAKTIHPDLGEAGPAKALRHELMAKANRAYAEDDSRTLHEILRNWRRSPDRAAEAEAGSDLLRITRQIARERQEIRVVKAKVEELKASYVWRFKKRVDANFAIGVDVLSDMVADADLDIARALKRLALARGEKQQERSKQPSRQTRKLIFPENICCGTVYLRGRDSVSYHTWKKLGPADGCLDVEVDQAVRLDIKDQVDLKLSRMQEIKPDDLQSLFLYEISDTDLDGIVHLTGLEELYLSGLQLTDAALRRLSPLTNLKRLFLYQTGITDRGLIHLVRLPHLQGLTSSGNSITKAGLASLERAFPGMETVYFSWGK
jgi:hypothetical protein